MTFVGKMLVVVQVVLSVVFMAFTAAVFTYHQNWKTKYEETNAQLQTVTAERNQLTTRAADREAKARTTLEGNGIPFDADQDLIAEAMKAFDERVRQHAEAVARAGAAETERDNLRTQQAAAEAALLVATKETELANAAEEARELDADVLRGLNLTSQKDLQEKEKTLRTVEDEKFALTRDVDQLTRRFEDKLAETSRLTQLLLQNGLDPDKQPESDDVPPPPVEGLVVKTKKPDNGSTELVEISIGSDDGLKMGDSLIVYRVAEGKFLGKIRLVYLTPDGAVGSLYQRAPNGTIQPGDSVASKL